jgi:hypothetical protein
MKLLRSAAVIGIAKTVYDQARKPENQAKIKSAVTKARSPRHTQPSRSSRLSRTSRMSRTTRRPR